MNGFYVISALVGIFSVAEATVATDCDTCTTNWNSATTCDNIKTYISCLIDTYESDSSKTGCNNTKTKMNDAKLAHHTHCGDNSATSTCLCEVDYYTSDLDCSAMKTKIACLDEASGLACDGTKTIAQLATATDTLIGDGSGNTCRTDLTETCKCQITYTKTDVSTTAKKCTALKAKITCLDEASGLGCDGTKKIDQLATSTDTLIVDGDGTNCRGDLTETCKCQITYTKTDVSTTAKKCTALKGKINCLEAATDVGCDGAIRSDQLAMKANESVVDGNGVNCRSELTSTCSCQITYATTDVTAAATKCMKLKEKMHCLVNAAGSCCDGTSTRSAVATSTYELIQDSVDNCRSGLTRTCACAINYAKTDVSSSTAAKCTAATTAQACLKNVTVTTDKACDGSTLTETYLNNTFVPMITEACSDAVTLRGVGLVLGITTMLYEMVRQL